MRAARALSWFVLVALVGGCQLAPSSQGLGTSLWPWSSALRSELAARAPSGRLPESAEPLRYRLRLRVDPDAARFEGAVSIDLRIAAPARELWLHGKGLRVSSASLELAGSAAVAARYREVEASGVAHLALAEEVPAGLATLNLAFDAAFDTAIDGLYRVEVAGRSYAFTQFEPIRARRALPCFDEPRFKVPIELTLEVPRGLAAFANTPERDRRPIGEGFDRVVFAPTRPIPTYLLAIAVGPLDVVEHAPMPPTVLRDRAVPLRGLAAAGKGERLAYALEHTAAIVEALERYVGSPYPYEKLDLVAVPDFAFGAMENAGLITYREILLLLDEHPALDQERAYASVHAHELAHQWFGNLVTMPWWDDIWLNESFATWMGNRAVHLWNPALEFDRQTVRSGHEVMGVDIYASSRRIREPVAGSEQIATAFDPISYSKGGAVIGMLEGWIGPEAFQRGIRRYLSQHAWGHATADEWIAAIEAVSGSGEPGVEPGALTRVARSFLEQAGVPVVHARVDCERGPPVLELSQERYLPIGSKLSPERRWSVPVCYRALPGDRGGERGARACVLLEGKERKVELAARSCPRALVPNRDGQGYFRFALSKRDWRALLSEFAALTPGEQLAVASNLEAELRAGRIDVEFYLRAVPTLIGERTRVQPAWDVVSRCFSAISWIADELATEEERSELALRMQELFEGVLARVGGEAAGVEARLFRQQILEFLAVELRAPDPQRRLAEEAVRALDSGVGLSEYDDSGPGALAPDLLGAALSSAVDAREAGFHARLRARFEASTQPAFRAKALHALARTTDPETRETLLDGDFLASLRTQEWSSFFWGAMARRENRRPIFEWYRRNFEGVRRRLPESIRARAPRLFSSFCDSDARAAVEELFEPWTASTPGLAHSLSQSLESIEHCAAARAALLPLRIPAG